MAFIDLQPHNPDTDSEQPSPWHTQFTLSNYFFDLFESDTKDQEISIHITTPPPPAIESNISEMWDIGKTRPLAETAKDILHPRGPISRPRMSQQKENTRTKDKDSEKSHVAKPEPFTNTRPLTKS